MQPIDPFAAPSTQSTYGMQNQGGKSVYPDGYLMVADIYSQLHDIFVSRGGVPAFETPQMDADIIEAQVII